MKFFPQPFKADNTPSRGLPRNTTRPPMDTTTETSNIISNGGMQEPQTTVKKPRPRSRANKDGDAPRPVSYTHLDVYKRQLEIR